MLLINPYTTRVFETRSSLSSGQRQVDADKMKSNDGFPFIGLDSLLGLSQETLVIGMLGTGVISRPLVRSKLLAT